MKPLQEKAPDLSHPGDRGAGELLGWKEALDHWEASSRLLMEAYDALKQQVRGLNCALEERNRALEGSLKEEARLRHLLSTILDALPVGVLVWDCKGQLLRVNRWARELLGWTGSEDHFALPGHCPSLAGTLNTLVSSALKGCTRSLEVTLRLQAAEERHLRLISGPLSGAGGDSGGVILAIEDLTDYRSLQEELARNQRLAAMGEMAATIVHQVRNPLGSIGLFASLMVDEPSREDRHRIERQIHGAIESLDQLLRNLLNFARPLKPKTRTLDLWGILGHCLDFIAPLARHKGVELIALEPEVYPWVRGDEELLKQAFLNVLLNALQAMPQGGTLKVWIEGKRGDGTTNREGFLEVNIEDTGSGIPQEHLGRVFDPFFTTRPDGSGLGLTVVHKVIRAHGGRVRIHSEVGKGSRVQMDIPVLGIKDHPRSENGLLIH